ncbi:uncharacterized protein LOC144770912 isoform X3 [Lissotriton helveticus]
MDPSNFSQIDAACEHVEKMQDPANATVTNVPPALDPAVITSNAGHLSAPQPAYDPDLQQAFDELMEYIEAQDALNSVQNTSVPTCTPTLCPNGVEVQEVSRESKESPLKRKALPSKVGPPSKKGVAKRPLSEAAQKHAAEERSAQPLRDITATVQNNRSATKGVTFHDVAAYLSEEEWSSLSERQKELYKNVMVEIHNAMIFLGYQIINADTLIRVYKGEEIAIRRSIGLEKRAVVGDSATSCDTTVKADILCRVKQKEYPCSSNTRGRDETEIRSSPSTGDPIITSVFTLSDKEEDALRRKNRPEPERREHVACSPTGDPFITSVFTLRGKTDQLKRKNLTEPERRDHITSSPKRGPAASPNVLLKQKDDRPYSTTNSAGRAETCKTPSTEDPIITSVYTIRDKDQPVLQRSVRQEPVRREDVHCSPKQGPAGNPGVLLKDDRSGRIISRAEPEMGKSPSIEDPIITSVYTISDNEALHRKTRLEPDRREPMDCSPNRGPPVNPDVLLKHRGVRCYSDANSGDETEEPIITSVYTLRVKEPEALHRKDRLEGDVDHSPRSPSLDDDVIYDPENSSDHPDGENAGGKTRTHQRYRMPYTSHQLEELEKEFYYNHYITAQRKEELVTTLGLTSRQIKIWFQNRRAKQKRTSKGPSQPQTPQSQQASSTTPTSPTVDSSREGMAGVYGSHFVP